MPYLAHLERGVWTELNDWWCICSKVEKLIDQYDIPPEGSSPLHFDGKYPTGFKFQIQALLWKCNITYWR